METVHLIINKWNLTCTWIVPNHFSSVENGDPEHILCIDAHAIWQPLWFGVYGEAAVTCIVKSR